MSTDARDVVPLAHALADPVGLPDAAHHLLLDDLVRGLADIADGRTVDADTTVAWLQEGLASRPRR